MHGKFELYSMIIYIHFNNIGTYITKINEQLLSTRCLDLC